MKNDPRYVKLVAGIITHKDGDRSEKILNYHKCTQEDWNDFYPTAESSQVQFDNIRNDENRGFNCLDWTDDFLIYGYDLLTKDRQKI